MDTATSTSRETRIGAQRSPGSGAHGTAASSGRMISGRRSCCVSNGAGSVHGMAFAPGRRTWITSSRITATGKSSRTAAICKACATAATAQRPWQKAELNLAARAAGRADAWSSARRRDVRGFGGKSQDFPDYPHPVKVFGGGASDRSWASVRDFFPMRAEKRGGGWKRWTAGGLGEVRI